MREIVRARPAITTLLTIVLVAGIGLPARAEAPGAPGPDPAPYTPPFELAHPVEGGPGFSDSFGSIRDGGDRLHHGIDIGASLETPVLAVAEDLAVFLGGALTASNPCVLAMIPLIGLGNGVGAQALGIAQGALDLAVDWAISRKQFLEAGHIAVHFYIEFIPKRSKKNMENEQRWFA